jgi:hypothetical protein
MLASVIWLIKIRRPTMKKTTALCLAVSLALGSAGTAQADWGGRHGDHDGYRHEYRHDRDYRGGRDWVGPAAILAITGLAIGAAAYSQQRPEPVYVAPPPPVRVQPTSGNWYYCNSAGQYYPYVEYCPEGWQQVMPPR